jgi:glycosyltransferase involved in cell wall biosynthesis
VGGVGEAVGEGVTGRLVAQGDEAALAAALAELLGDGDLRRRMGAGAEQAYAERFRVGTMVDSVEALYRHLLEASG